MEFKLRSRLKPTGDQPKAIKKLTEGLKSGYRDQTLLGVTGSGKTFTMANIIQNMQKPTLVISHNKTLAAQLYGEFRRFFPENAVHYFVSYYDYYQPEAYIPHTDTYIEKEATINEEIDRLRHAATQSLLNRKDVLIVASVSCIYGLGGREDYEAMSEHFKVGQTIKRNELLRRLIKIQYERNDTAFLRGQFRVKGEIIDIHLATGEAVVRIEMFGDVINNMSLINTNLIANNRGIISKDSRNNLRLIRDIAILPAKHFMTPEDKIKAALRNIRKELKERVAELKKQKKIIEAERLIRKTNYDLEMIEEVGYCNGIENYSRHLTGRPAGSPPETLMDFFPKDYLLFIDESHVSLPQIRGMYAGDKARKQTLIDFGFRLPSARDNRPLNFKEFNAKINQVIYVSATPGEYEIRNSAQVVEQIIRPTGLLDPEVEVRTTVGCGTGAPSATVGRGAPAPRPTSRLKPQESSGAGAPLTTVGCNIKINPSSGGGQIPDLIQEIEKRVKKKQRVLVTVLTKRMAEELSDYLTEQGIKTCYLHSEIDTLERVDILRDLRQGKYDCLIGVNLLREGLDLPEVSLVAILDADMAGFLRNETSLVQTIGRAARHAEGKVIMYADKITPALAFAINETNRRRRAQIAYNKKHGIKPRTIKSKFHKNII
jgi:excinuclease ABC subunit B